MTEYADLTSAERELEEELNALRLARQILDRRRSAKVSVKANGHAHQINHSHSANGFADGGDTLKTDVLEYARLNPEDDLTARGVHRGLEKMGRVFEAKKPWISISSALSDWTRDGQLRLIRKGRGNHPHVYRYAGSPEPEPQGAGQDQIVGLSEAE